MTTCKQKKNKKNDAVEVKVRNFYTCSTTETHKNEPVMTSNIGWTQKLANSQRSFKSRSKFLFLLRLLALSWAKKMKAVVAISAIMTNTRAATL